MLGQIYDAFCEMQKKKEAKCGKLPCFASSKDATTDYMGSTSK